MKHNGECKACADYLQRTSFLTDFIASYYISMFLATLTALALNFVVVRFILYFIIGHYF